MRAWLLLFVGLNLSALEVPARATAHQVAVWRVPEAPAATLTFDGLRRASFAVGGGCEIRHAPRRPGLQSWVLTAADGRILGQGQVEVAPGDGGPVRVVKRRLALPDGTPFLALGPNLAWMEGDDPLPGFRRAFERLARHGGTHARVWLCSWSLGLGEDLDPRRAAQVDAVLAEARARHLRLTLVLENHTDLRRQPGWSAVPLTPAIARRLDVAVARWGADDTVLAWELGNELDLAEANPHALDRWLIAAAARVRAQDPDRRPVISSWCGPGWATSSAPLDWFGVHPYVHEFTEVDEGFRAPSRDALREFEEAAHQDRLWWAMEGGYQGQHDHNPGNDLDHEGLLLRQQLWAGFCLGLAPAMTWWWDTHLDARNLWPLYGALGKIAERLTWQDQALQQVAPNPQGPVRVLGWASPTQALLWPQVRADTWYRALVKQQPRSGLAQRQPVRLGGFRPGQGYAWERWQPVDGSPGPVTTLNADAQGVVTLTLEPGTVDEVWVLRLTDAELK